jgi:hypothetical protein
MLKLGRFYWAFVGLGIWASLASCASTGDPPGGPPDQRPPTVLRVAPESGAVLTVPPAEATVYFDEVISERVAGQPNDITGAILLSPAQGEVRVGWHRDRLTVRPRAGFVAGRVYHLEVLPVVTDLRTNRLRAGRTIVFSTGPEIPGAALEGSVVDWVAGRAAIGALIEAVLLPDSLTYRALADSAGYFRLAQIPPGRYLVRAVMDTNNDRRLGTREAYDSVSVGLDSSSAVELFAFVHDTTGPRLRLVEVTDSLTLKLTFDRPLLPAAPLDTGMVSVATLEDSTTHLPLLGVFTPKALEALQKHEADSIAAAAARADSLAAATDTTRRPTADSARPAVRAPARGAPAPVRPATGPVRPAAAPVRPAAPGARAPLDSTRAERMVARRPAPTDIRIVRLAAPLIPDTRYVIHVTGARSLTGNESNPRGQVRAPRPRAAPRAARPRAPSDSAAAADSTRPVADSTAPAGRPIRP